MEECLGGSQDYNRNAVYSIFLTASRLAVSARSAKSLTSLATMQLTAIIVALSSLFSFSLAAPQVASTTTTVSSTVPTSTESYLRTQVSHGESPYKNNLDVSAYHTGAGLNDAVLGPFNDGSAKGFLNGTFQQFDLGTTFPWGFVMVMDSQYAGMVFLIIWHNIIAAPLTWVRDKYADGQSWVLCSLGGR